MSPFEVFVVILTSGIFLGILAIFYRMGRVHEFMESKFKSIDEHFEKIDERFNKMDERFNKMDERLNKMDERFNEEFGQLNTRVAVIESRLSDISTNVTYLMWHHQAIPSREEMKDFKKVNQ
jgi:DNA anti-recombination protein RmuC